MLLAMSYSQSNERVLAGGGQAPAAAGEEAPHAPNPFLVSVGRLMTRAIPFLLVMLHA